MRFEKTDKFIEGTERYPVFYICTGCGHLYFCFNENPTYKGQMCPCYRFSKEEFHTVKYALT